MSGDHPEPRAQSGVEEPLTSLLNQLANVHRAIEDLVGAEIDAVMDPGDGRTWLLREAQAAVITSAQARHREALFRAAVIDALPANVAVLDERGSIVAVNAAWRRFADANGSDSVHGFVGADYLHVCEAATGEDREVGLAVAAGIREVAKGARDRFSIQYPCHAPAQERWFRVLVTRIEGQQDAGVVVTHLDVSEQVIGERALRAVQRRTASFLDAVADGVIAVAPDGRVEGLNPSAREMLGLREGEALGEHVQRLIGDTAVAPIQAVLEGRGPRRVDDTTFTRAGAEPLPVSFHVREVHDADGGVSGAVVSFEDRSERMELEAMLASSQRLESLGQLTGGVAHDFNNLLTVIAGNAELIADGLGTDATRRSAELIRVAAERGASMTQQLLAFARRQPLAPSIADLCTVLEDVRGMLDHVAGDDVELVLETERGLWPVKIDVARLENALLNLALNARDAMPRGGRVSLRASNHRLGSSEAARLGLQVGRHVRVEVVDEGTGIAVENLSRVFEPFFTTKPQGKGTGLGLSMVYGFVKQSGGSVEVDSVPGAGARFIIYLPAHSGDAEREVATRSLTAVGAPTSTAAAMEATRPASPGSERAPELASADTAAATVLLVEDDEIVRQYARELLNTLGYHVLEAASASVALRVLEEREHVDLVFSDIVMPGIIDGLGLSDIVRRSWPETRLLLTSGYAAHLVHGGKEPSSQVEVLPKPYGRGELAAALSNALRSTGTRAGNPSHHEGDDRGEGSDGTD